MDFPPQSSGSYTRPKRKTEPYAERLIVKDVLGTMATNGDATPTAPAWRRRLSSILAGPWILILGFGAMILAGTLLLKLPWSAAPGQSITWSDAYFTATSAVTVTGLTVVSTAVTFSLFGQIIILILLQVGGVGFISLSVLLFRLIGRRVTLQARFIVQQSLATSELNNALNLALYVLGVSLTLEAIGALLLWLRWRDALPFAEAIWYAVFHAVSIYSNAGFDLFSGTHYPVLFGFGTDWYTLGIMGILILLGAVGITVMYDIWSDPRPSTWSVNTRITLVLMGSLTALGSLVILLDPRLSSQALPAANWVEWSAVGIFTIISRTAGFGAINVASLSESTQFLIMLWMFIGGAPASMAGGVSTSTVGVLLFAVIATARGRGAAVAFGRTLPHETIAKAVAIMSVSTVLVVAATMLLVLDSQEPIFSTGFEVVSAFSNAGYSLDFTPRLSEFGRFLVAFTMFWGRLGPLTIVVALAQREQPTLIRFPEEPVILG